MQDWKLMENKFTGWKMQEKRSAANIFNDARIKACLTVYDTASRAHGVAQFLRAVSDSFGINTPTECSRSTVPTPIDNTSEDQQQTSTLNIAIGRQFFKQRRWASRQQRR
jgi:hypothetical protein